MGLWWQDWWWASIFWNVFVNVKTKQGYCKIRLLGWKRFVLTQLNESTVPVVSVQMQWLLTDLLDAALVLSSFVVRCSEMPNMHSYDLALRISLTLLWLLLQRPCRRISDWPHLVAADLDDVLHVSCSTMWQKQTVPVSSSRYLIHAKIDWYLLRQISDFAYVHIYIIYTYSYATLMDFYIYINICIYMHSLAHMPESFTFIYLYIYMFTYDFTYLLTGLFQKVFAQPLSTCGEVILMPPDTWMMAEDLESLLADAPLCIGARHLVTLLPHYLRLWRSESRLWWNGRPPSELASKLYLCSRRWTALLPGLFTDTSFYNFLTFRAPLPEFLSFLWSLPNAERCRPLQLSLRLLFFVVSKDSVLG